VTEPWRRLAAGCLLLACLAACTGHALPLAADGPALASPAITYVHDPGHVTGIVPVGCHVHGQLPDQRCTPGSADPAITQATLRQTICVPGWTSEVRPPVSETDRLKARMSVAYHIPGGIMSELDHLLPLSLGGSNDTSNLWIEPGQVPNPKDKAEDIVHHAVCRRGNPVPLSAAQKAMVTDWTTAVHVLGLDQPARKVGKS
jgi:hypothetical protein